MKIYVVSRSAKTDRPGCIHICTEAYGNRAVCGYSLIGSTRGYTDTPLLTILCKTCDKIASR